MLFLEEKVSQMNEKIKKNNCDEETTSIIELCEDWWEMLRQEQVLFDVYVTII